MNLETVKKLHFESITKNATDIVGYHCITEGRNFRFGVQRHYLLFADF